MVEDYSKTVDMDNCPSPGLFNSKRSTVRSRLTDNSGVPDSIRSFKKKQTVRIDDGWD